METTSLFTRKYGDKYTAKIKHLEKSILEGETGADRYTVLPFEAGLGKSLETDRIVGEYLASAPLYKRRHFLIVKKFVEDVHRSVDRINNFAGKTIALGIDSESWQELKLSPDTLSLFPVLVVTHERYNRLSRNVQDREFFTEGRHTMILDEAINVALCTFSEKEYKSVLAIVPVALEKLHQEASKGFNDELIRLRNENKGKNAIGICSPFLDYDVYRDYKNAVEANRHHFSSHAHYETTIRYIEALGILSEAGCVYNNGRLSNVNIDVKRWGLRNNLILDANGSIDWQYRFDPQVTVDRQTPIMTHENWNLYQVPVNASISSIKKSKNYHDEICRMILEYKQETGKTLVVTQKAIKEDIVGRLIEAGVQGVEVAYFGDIIGKNDWRDFNQVWVIASPNYRMEDYALRWSLATGRDLKGRDLSFVASKGVLRFKDPDIEKIRFGCVISELYQAIKRINRDNTQVAEVFVVTADYDVIKELQKHLRLINDMGQLEANVQKRLEQQRKKTIGDQLAETLNAMPQGEHLKSTLCATLKISKKNLARYLKDAKVQEIVTTRGIQVNHKSVVVPSGHS